jgi:DNA-binding PadR family transcriptional regulator
MTLLTQLVLRALFAEPTKEKYGLQICTVASLPSGTIHPILARLEQLGWLVSVWEDIDAHKGGRPRRYSRLAKEGAEDARIALARATTPPISTLPGLRPRPQATWHERRAADLRRCQCGRVWDGPRARSHPPSNSSPRTRQR